MAKSASSDWLAEHLRFSLFSDVTWSGEAEQIYQAIFTHEPIESSRKPTSGESNASGSTLNAKALVAKTINRVDIVIQSDAEPSVPAPMLDNVESRFDELRVLVARWLAVQQQPIVRVAVSGRLFLPTAGVQESYEKLKELVQVIQIDADRFREMQFQVNLARKSTVNPDLNINRLTHWGSLTQGIGLMSANGVVTQHALNQTYCFCTFDMNTPPNINVPFQADVVIAFLSEIYGEAIAVLHGGIS